MITHNTLNLLLRHRLCVFTKFEISVSAHTRGSIDQPKNSDLHDFPWKRPSRSNEQPRLNLASSNSLACYLGAFSRRPRGNAIYVRSGFPDNDERGRSPLDRYLRQRRWRSSSELSQGREIERLMNRLLIGSGVQTSVAMVGVAVRVDLVTIREDSISEVWDSVDRDVRIMANYPTRRNRRRLWSSSETR